MSSYSLVVLFQHPREEDTGSLKRGNDRGRKDDEGKDIVDDNLDRDDDHHADPRDHGEHEQEAEAAQHEVAREQTHHQLHGLTTGAAKQCFAPEGKCQEEQ